jgi:creatinine amidohydrolase
VALIPVGATEQHGPHFPVGTDTIIATAVADAAAGEVAVVLPPLAFGASFFHGTRMPGTVAFSGEETGNSTTRRSLCASPGRSLTDYSRPADTQVRSS